MSSKRVKWIERGRGANPALCEAATQLAAVSPHSTFAGRVRKADKNSLQRGLLMYVCREWLGLNDDEIKEQMATWPFVERDQYGIQVGGFIGGEEAAAQRERAAIERRQAEHTAAAQRAARETRQFREGVLE